MKIVKVESGWKLLPKHAADMAELTPCQRVGTKVRLLCESSEAPLLQRRKTQLELLRRHFLDTGCALHAKAMLAIKRDLEVLEFGAAGVV